MLVYYIEDDTLQGADRRWARTRGEAHRMAKERSARDPIIVLVDLDTTHEGVVSTLRGEPRVKLVRAWTLSNRLGLKDCPLSEVAQSPGLIVTGSACDRAA